MELRLVNHASIPAIYHIFIIIYQNLLHTADLFHLIENERKKVHARISIQL